MASLFLIVFGFGLFVSVVNHLRRRRRLRVPPKPAVLRCRCGYPMDQLDSVRCPECGRVSGFDATAEELELTDEQLRQAKAKRDARADQAAAAAESSV